ncbi:MAG TPA: TonB-dependent receptor [Deltaproteobacteria bacterium]|nr:TonB-dependent receptor [Deltaproteobacteria bacterium]
MPFATQILGLLLCMSTTVHAQDLADEADTNFRLGAAAYQRGALDEALLYFMQANRLSPNTASAGNVGHTYTALGKFPEAYRWYAYALSLTDEPTPQLEEAMARIEASVVLVEVTSTPPGATVYVDRKNLGSVGTTPVTLALDRGTYTIIVEAEGYVDFVSEPLALTERGMRTTVSPELEAIVGRVQITGDEGATVHLNQPSSPALCTIPCTVELPTGQQLLHFRAEGYRSQPSLINVLADQVVQASAELVLITGSVRVEADEIRAQIEIDGVVRGFTPAVINGVRAGTRTIRITKDGFAPFETTIEVPKDDLMDLGRVVLEPLGLVSSASRYEEELFTAPASITVISAAEIHAFGYPSLSEALRGVRGVSHSDEFAQLIPSMRGIGGTNGGRTKKTLDGLVVTSPLLGATSNSAFSQHYLDQIQRIEVTRGAGSLLYGAGAMNGLIAIQRRDRTEGAEGELQGGVVGSEAFGRGFVAVGDKVLGLYTSLSAQRDPGRPTTLRDFAIPQYDPDTGEPLTDPLGQGITMVGDYDVEHYLPYSSVQSNGKAWAKDLELRWQATAVFDAEINQGIQPSDPNVEGQTAFGNENLFLDLVYRPRISDRIDVQLRAAYAKAQTRLSFGSFVGNSTIDFLTDVDWITTEARGVFDLNDRLRVLTGLEALRAFDSSATQALTADALDQLDLDESVTSPVLRENPFILSAYGVGDLHLSRSLRINAGVRVDRWASLIPPDEVGVDPPQVQPAINPRVVAIYQPTDRDVIKAMGYTGFRQPDLFERRTSNGISVISPLLAPGFRELGPEQMIGGELEYQGRFGRDWTALVSVWGSRYTDLPQDMPTGIEGVFNNELTTRANVADIDAYGADWELRRRFKGGWMVYAWYGYQRSFTTLPAPGTADIYDPDRWVTTETPDQPRHLASLKVIAPAAERMRVATRFSFEGPRLREDGVRTNPSLIADFVVSGSLINDRFQWRAGIYNALATEATLPVLPDYGRRFLATITARGPLIQDN